MKKTLITSLLMIFFVTKAYPQVPIDANTIILTTIQTLNEVSNQIQDDALFVQAKQLASKGSSFLETYQSLEIIYELLEDFTCNLHDLNLYVEGANRKGDCLFNLEFNMATANLSMSTDILKYAVLGSNLAKMGNEMDAGARNRLLQGIIDALRNSMNDIDKLRASLKGDWEYRIIERYNKKKRQERNEVYDTALKFNRYHR